MGFEVDIRLVGVWFRGSVSLCVGWVIYMKCYFGVVFRRVCWFIDRFGVGLFEFGVCVLCCILGFVLLCLL